MSLAALLVPLLILAQEGTGTGSVAPPPLVITNVTVIDGTGAPPSPATTIEIAGGVIRGLSRGLPASLPEGARVVDSGGKYVIPGLWDMHVHVLFEGVPEVFFPLFVANGVTGIRDMSSDLALAKRLREEFERGERIGPRIVAASPIVDGPTPYWPGSLPVATPAEARAAVHTLHQGGADFVKVYSGLSRESFFAVLDEARGLGLPVAGHVPSAVRLGEAADSGQRCVEHLDGLLRACSTREEELRAGEVDLLERFLARDTSAALTHRRRELQQLGGRTFSAAKADSLIARLARSGMWQDPTLITGRLFTALDDCTRLTDPRLRYVPSWLRAMWNLDQDPRTRDRRTPEDLDFARRSFERSLGLVGAMHRAGIGLLAGSDALQPFCYPGFSLHDELELLVRAGLTPMAALRCATAEPARFLGMEARFGTIAAGRAADLVLLEANPLADIRNTRRIAAVVLGGRLLMKPDLERLLAEAEEAAKRDE